MGVGTGTDLQHKGHLSRCLRASVTAESSHKSRPLKWRSQKDKAKCGWVCGVTGTLMEATGIEMLQSLCKCIEQLQSYSNCHSTDTHRSQCLLKTDGNLGSHRNLYINIYGNFIHNCSHMETTQLPFGGWVHKQHGHITGHCSVIRSDTLRGRIALTSQTLHTAPLTTLAEGGHRHEVAWVGRKA